MTILVFSKDRALQLDAFLRSYEQFVWPVCPVEVLYRTTSERHAAAYLDVFARHRCAVPRPQTTFKDDVLALLPETGHVVCFVDDQVFTRRWAVDAIAGLSLRLAPHLTACYPMRTDQPLPPFIPFSASMLSWRWAEGQGDWGYPLSLDGHVFDAAEFKPLVASLTFDSPNSLEEALYQARAPFLARQGFCYQEAKVVNVPWTRVQTDCENRFAGVTPDELLTYYELQWQIDLAPFVDVRNVSCHQEFPLALELR